MQAGQLFGYDRLEAKERLRAVHRSLNPFILKKTIEQKLRVIFKQVKVTSNVRQRI